MTKEEILAKSREENKNNDIAMIECEKKASTFALTVVMILTTIFWALELVVTGRMNLTSWAIVTVANATLHFYMFFSMRKKKNLICAILWAITSVISIISTVSTLFSTSTIL